MLKINIYSITIFKNNKRNKYMGIKYGIKHNKNTKTTH